MALCVAIKHDNDFCFEIFKSTLKTTMHSYILKIVCLVRVCGCGCEIKIYSILSMSSLAFVDLIMLFSSFDILSTELINRFTCPLRCG